MSAPNDPENTPSVDEAEHTVSDWNLVARPCQGGAAKDDLSPAGTSYPEAEFDERVQQMQKLESLGLLAGGIAHDFNNLLMGILGNADLALDKLPATSPVRENIEEIEQAARRAADLCRQMLAYSGKGRFVIASVNLNDLVLEMVHLLGSSISKKVKLRYELARDLPVFDADPTQIRQIIMNLITNASEAVGDATGTIRVRTGAEEHAANESGEGRADAVRHYVYLEVTDSGCGMDPETLQKIFDPFFTTKATGRGLGLSAVRGIVRANKATLTVATEPGKGARFKVLFPASVQTDQSRPGSSPLPGASRGTTPEGLAPGRGELPGNESETSPEPMTPAGSGTPGGLGKGASCFLPQTTPGPRKAACPPSAKGTVLVVDDEEMVLQVTQHMLEKDGFKVLTARDGAEALDVFRANSDAIVAVVLDLTMPRMNGEEVFRQIAALKPATPVLLTSGYTEEDVAARFATKTATAFIQKPYQARDLIGKVHEALKM